MNLVSIAVIVCCRSNLSCRNTFIDVGSQKAPHACPRGRGPSPPHLPLGQGSTPHAAILLQYMSMPNTLQPCPPGHHALYSECATLHVVIWTIVDNAAHLTNEQRRRNAGESMAQYRSVERFVFSVCSSWYGGAALLQRSWQRMKSITALRSMGQSVMDVRSLENC